MWITAQAGIALSVNTAEKQAGLRIQTKAKPKDLESDTKGASSMIHIYSTAGLIHASAGGRLNQSEHDIHS